MDPVEDDYIERKNVEMKPKFEANVKKMFDDICLKVRRQIDEGISRENVFYIAHVNFTDGEEKSEQDYPLHLLNKVVDMLQSLSNTKLSQNEKTVEKMQSMNKPIPDVVKNFVPLKNITLVLHTYNVKYLGVYISSSRETLKEMTTYISKMFPPVYTINSVECLDLGEVKLTVFDNRKNTTMNVMVESDNVHKYAHQYYIEKGLIKRDEDEEMIFGDDLL